jgi:hypothetical protein
MVLAGKMGGKGRQREETIGKQRKIILAEKFDT